jgi:hypothetical protein
MRNKRRKTKSLIGTLAIAGIISSSAYAFTASITVPSSNAGDGNTAITLPNVSAAHYNLLGSDPTKIASVDLTFASGVASAATTQMKAKVVSTSSTWTNLCTPTNASGGTATIWNCAYASGSEATDLAADNLRVVAVT